MNLDAELPRAGATTNVARYPSHRKTLLAIAAGSVGPGLMVMLADTDAGSIVTFDRPVE